MRIAFWFARRGCQGIRAAKRFTLCHPRTHTIGFIHPPWKLDFTSQWGKVVTEKTEQAVGVCKQAGTLSLKKNYPDLYCIFITRASVAIAAGNNKRLKGLASWSAAQDSAYFGLPNFWCIWRISPVGFSVSFSLPLRISKGYAACRHLICCQITWIKRNLGGKPSVCNWNLKVT